jgi:hypothetical protein
MEIDFSKYFQIISASKSRVVLQAAEERNYHIFYQVGISRMLLKMVMMVTRMTLTMIPQLARHRHPLHCRVCQDSRVAPSAQLQRRQPQEHVKDHGGCQARLDFVDDDSDDGLL